jgi:ankyrin repeat protein
MALSSETEKLCAAAQAGDLAAVRTLVAQGCPLDSFDELGNTPLHYAAANERDDVAVFLLESGADVDAHDESVVGDTPLGAIAGRCSLRMAQILVGAGADPTIRGWMQLSALERARNRKRGEGPAVYALLLHEARRGPSA